jgi:hypothetical protein
MKGALQGDHIPLNKYQLIVLGMPELTFTEIGGLEEELETVDLPDRTVASGGQTKPVEFTAMLPAHHMVQQAAMELWFKEGQDPVLSTYKKTGTLMLKSISGNTIRTYSLLGLFVSKRATPDLEMANEGEMAGIEWTFKADQMLPI